jgi:hypothetical protein
MDYDIDLVYHLRDKQGIRSYKYLCAVAIRIDEDLKNPRIFRISPPGNNELADEFH